MRIIDTKRLDDGKGFNQGQDSRLIMIESPADFDQLQENILTTDYYGKQYFATRISHEAETIKAANLLVAAMARLLRPRSVLELGCGRGDILLLLSLAGVDEVAGIDISAEVVGSMWPRLADKVHLGDLLDFCPAFARQGKLFDTVVALDIWEHLHPARLDDYIRAVIQASTADALFYFNIPAFGPDRAFGEAFPLEYEENRRDFEAGRPFSFLLADSVDPPIPVNGHLIWASSGWWEEQFARQGLTRAIELEKRLHELFDDHLFYAQRAFFIFHRAQAPTARLSAIASANMDQTAKAGQLKDLLLAVNSFEDSYGKPVLDAHKTLMDLNHSLDLVRGQPRRRAELLVPLVKFLRRDERYRHGEALVYFEQKLDHDLHLIQDDLYARAGEMAARWPLPPGRGLRLRLWRGLARRRFERYQKALLSS